MRDTNKELTAISTLNQKFARKQVELYEVLDQIRRVIPNLGREVTIKTINELIGTLDTDILPVASATQAGIVDTTTQTFAGAKTFNGIPVLAGGGIQFPSSQIASSNANTLDDYEEGTWTPVLGGDGGESGQTYSTQTGKYTKLGDRIAYSGAIVFSNKGIITGNLVLKGIPFTNSSAYSTGVAIWSNFATSFVAMALSINPNDIKIYVYGITAASTGLATFRTTADVNNTSALLFAGHYGT